MRRYILIQTLLILTASTEVGLSQSSFKYGVELGLSISQIPINDTYTSQNGINSIYSKDTPLFGPLIGLSSEVTLKKHFQFSLELQYQLAGHRSYYQYYRHNNPNGLDFTSDVWENLTFHKLCLQLTAGFTVKIWKLQPAIFIGYRPNYFILGKYYSKEIYDSDIDSLCHTSEYEFNPLDKNKMGFPVKHFHQQYIVGLSSLIGQHFKFSAAVAGDGRGQIYYSENAESCMPYSFYNTDYFVTITYFIKTLTKNKTK